MRPRRSSIVIVGMFAILTAGSARAQFLESFEESLWGVQGSFTPTWQFPNQFKNLLKDVAEIDLSGSEYTIGFARGRMSGGHWGLSLVRQRIDEGSVCQGTDCADLAGVSLQGFEFGSFLAFGEPFAGDRIQIGMHVGSGLGWYQGVVQYRGEDTDVSELLTFQNQSIPIPIFRAEFAVAATVAPGLKIIGSGGYGFPGNRRPTVSVAYFPLGGR
jgi:hypothetical protein